MALLEFEAPLGATRTKHSAVAARYRRVLLHRGHKKAIVAVAHNLLVTAYHVLARQTTYQELGADYYDRRHTERVARRAIPNARAAGLPGYARTRRLTPGGVF